MEGIDLSKYSSIPFDHGVLMSLFDDYKAPNDKIYNLLKNGTIISLKKGFYVLGEKYRNKPLNKNIIANALYGPSYVSMDTALSYYGLIPESVSIVQSITTKRSKEFQTVFGKFSYSFSTKIYFPVGVSWHTSAEKEAFLMATPEKALCDKIVFSKKLNLRSVKSLKDFLFDDLRIEEEQIAGMNIDIILCCSGVSKKQKALNLLIDLIQKL